MERGFFILLKMFICASKVLQQSRIYSLKFQVLVSVQNVVFQLWYCVVSYMETNI
jgi:hypothetical protein